MWNSLIRSHIVIIMTMCSNCLIKRFTEAEGHHSLGVHLLGMSQNQQVRMDDEQELAQKN